MMENFEARGIAHEIRNILCCNLERDETLKEITTLLKERVFHYDWVGFYIMEEDKNGLYLGPYTGKSTIHTFIPLGKGICGQVAENKETMIVQDVNSVENYLSCSIDVRSEIVVPILKNGEFVAEIDIDSHSPSPFSEADKSMLEEICRDLAVLF